MIVVSDDKQLTATQQAILYKKKENPSWSNQEIANAVDCSASHVSETLSRWKPGDLRDDGTVPHDGQKPITLTWLLFVLPLKLCWWGVKFTVWCFLLPFKILGFLLGSGNQGEDS